MRAGATALMMLLSIAPAVADPSWGAGAPLEGAPAVDESAWESADEAHTPVATGDDAPDDDARDVSVAALEALFGFDAFDEAAGADGTEFEPAAQAPAAEADTEAPILERFSTEPEADAPVLEHVGAGTDADEPVVEMKLSPGVLYPLLSLLELLDADYTFLNEKLAKHYALTNLNITGPEMRLVNLPAGSPRGGVLGQGSVHVVTSNPTRT
jgi:hypothetical protein